MCVCVFVCGLEDWGLWKGCGWEEELQRIKNVCRPRETRLPKYGTGSGSGGGLDGDDDGDGGSGGDEPIDKPLD